MTAILTTGSIIKNPRGSLENKPGEGVRVNMDRWIESRRLRLDGRERERENGRRRRRQTRWLPRTAARKLAGEPV